MRVWDTFVVDTNNFAQAVLYAADNGIEVVEGAVGGLFNSRFARSAFELRLPARASSSRSSRPTSTRPTTTSRRSTTRRCRCRAPSPTCRASGQNPPQEVIDFFNDLGIPLGTNAPIGTWFRNSGTTQYGGHAHIVMPAVTGSAATGQASGAAGLRRSRTARQRRASSSQPNEIKQLLTMTAEDVVAPRTPSASASPTRRRSGWDQHFGYGLPDLGLALERIDAGQDPAAGADHLARVVRAAERRASRRTSRSSARVSAKRAAGYTYKLQWAPGIEPAESDFQRRQRPDADAADRRLARRRST